jgi:hypothetical protein
LVAAACLLQPNVGGSNCYCSIAFVFFSIFVAATVV